MDRESQSLFQVFLRLRPAASGASVGVGDRFLAVEDPEPDHSAPKHITLNPPNDRRRAIEKFAFTQVFEEDASQLDVFHCTGVVNLVEGVLAPRGGEGTDALLATLGVTGSGKTHTILGSRSQRGLTQLALDVIFRSLGQNLLDCSSNPTLEHTISASDPSEATVFSASSFLENVYGDMAAPSRASSRAPTPMIVRSSHSSFDFDIYSDGEDDHLNKPTPRQAQIYPTGHSQTNSPKSVRVVCREDSVVPQFPPKTPLWRGQRHHLGDQAVFSSPSLPRGPQYQRVQQLTSHSKGQGPLKKHFMASTASIRQKAATKPDQPQGESFGPSQTPSRRLHRTSAFPQQPDVSALSVSCDPSCEYAVVISMYEVYNDRIFDLLTPPVKSAATKEYRRRPLLFKSTESSPDRKLVAGLRKVVCGSLNQALMVLEAGLHERRVAGTGSNSVSSRSHGFFCVEVKKRAKGSRRHGLETPWGGSALTIVDLAGSERARDAKTAGATLAEAGKINESLMYLGQCLQMQSDAVNKDKPNLVPFRQCKLTELLFSNCFPSTSSYSSSHRHRNPQKAVMIVTADPLGDFNATSQILRYSALAREVTVPRIPSITQTILTNVASSPPQQFSSPVGSPPLHHRPFFPPGSTGTSANSYSPTLSSSPNIERTFSHPNGSSPGSDMHRATMEVAAMEISRLSEEVEYLRQAFESERAARYEAESHLLSMEDRMMELEQAIREDCVAEFERRLEIEMARWRANMQVEMERGEEHWGRKIEVFERGIMASTSADTEEEENKENVLMEDINQENERLRRDNDILRRELACMSPTKRVPLQERGSDLSLATGAESRTSSPKPARNNKQNAATDENNLRKKLERLRVSDDNLQASAARNSGSLAPSVGAKKVRKLATKRWDSGMDDEDLF
ncbi:P-loop containing nucleoside triphosphate hydrolase protein [Apodospora peruviana]|uniref:P-loop containing nucleoside triphosphate hydrolase protein n=1 Tax=Apodospora peruviana TaxID=516989 RepID=A0AAE0I6I1_9PEZI|nr:P-loop containing nucleoside triphosphate hydrolase protein [Apodospora peruviana]